MHLLLTGLPGEPPGMEISITLFGGKTYTSPGGSNSCGVLAPLIIWRSTGRVGGTKDALLTVNLKAVGVGWTWMSRFKLTSAAPGLGIPGAAGSLRGWRLVSTRRLLIFCDVVGSASDAPLYRRMAELSPPVKVAFGILGKARIQ